MGQSGTKKRRRKNRLSTVNPNAAGIDVGSQFHVVAVPADRDEEPVRTFQSFTGDLHRLADWLVRCRIDTVAMESTGIYWIPLYEILEARGITVVVANARDVKHVPGRKTDVNDAQWLQQLHEYGLLRGSFHPAADIAALRAYLRQRERLLDYAASHIQHMQKALMQMNLQLHHVVSDITGKTGMRIIRAILEGRASRRCWRSFEMYAARPQPRRLRRHSKATTARNTSSHWARPWPSTIAIKGISPSATNNWKRCWRSFALPNRLKSRSPRQGTRCLASRTV